VATKSVKKTHSLYYFDPFLRFYDLNRNDIMTVVNTPKSFGKTIAIRSDWFLFLVVEIFLLLLLCSAAITVMIKSARVENYTLATVGAVFSIVFLFLLTYLLIHHFFNNTLHFSATSLKEKVWKGALLYSDIESISYVKAKKESIGKENQSADLEIVLNKNISASHILPFQIGNPHFIRISLNKYSSLPKNLAEEIYLQFNNFRKQKAPQQKFPELIPDQCLQVNANKTQLFQGRVDSEKSLGLSAQEVEAMTKALSQNRRIE